MSTQGYIGRNGEILKVMRDMESAYPFVKLLDPRPLLSDAAGTGFLVVEDGRSLYYDDSHLSSFGAEKVLPLFASALQKKDLP
jgi:hypothetical protein